MTSRREIVGPSGAELDQAITDIEGGEFRAYSTDEAAAGAIIAREEIYFLPIPDGPDAPDEKWMASISIPGVHFGSARGPTKTVAAMRVHWLVHWRNKTRIYADTQPFIPDRRVF